MNDDSIKGMDRESLRDVLVHLFFLTNPGKTTLEIAKKKIGEAIGLPFSNTPA